MATSRFEGKVVVVTAAGGTGAGGIVCRRFAAEGAKVVASSTNRERLDQLVRSTDCRNGGEVVAFAADVTEPQEVAELVRFAVASYGRLDVMVNHASGLTRRMRGRNGLDGQTIVEMDLDYWHDRITGTLNSVFYGCRASLPHLFETRGCIVNTASISGMGSDYAKSAYNAAKAGVINLTRAIAVDHGAQGVRANSVSPGAIMHDGPANLFNSVAAQYLGRVPLGRFGTPDDVAAAIMFLASEDAAYITGHNLVVDGGVTASNGQFPFHRPREEPDTDSD